MAKIPLNIPYFDSGELKEIQKALNSGWVTRGPMVEEFEKRVKRYLGVKHAIAVSNCTSALHLGLLALGIKKGDEVLVPDYTFPATAYAALYCGAKPVFVDIDPKTYNIDPSLIEQKITRRTKAIIPVHTFGQPARMDAIMSIAKRKKLHVIEDAACAFGAKYKSRKAGTIGDIGCFSLHARKGITSGEGGIAVTNNKRIAALMRRFSMYGTQKVRSRKKNLNLPKFEFLGYNYKMSDITGAVAIAQLGKLDRIIKKKRSLAAYWGKQLRNIRFISRPFADKKAHHIYQSYVTLVDDRIDRDSVIRKLARRGIESHIGTYALHMQPVFRSKVRLVNSYRIFKKALALPMYYKLTEKNIDLMIKNLREILEG